MSYTSIAQNEYIVVFWPELAHGHIGLDELDFVLILMLMILVTISMYFGLIQIKRTNLVAFVLVPF